MCETPNLRFATSQKAKTSLATRQRPEIMNYHYYCHFPGMKFIQLP